MNKTRKNKKKSLKYLGKILKKKAGSDPYQLPPGGLFSDLGFDDTTFEDNKSMDDDDKSMDDDDKSINYDDKSMDDDDKSMDDDDKSMDDDDKREKYILSQFLYPNTEGSFAAINDSEIKETVVKDNRVTPSPRINERIIVDKQEVDEKVTYYHPQNLEECLKSDDWNVYEKWIFENINNPYPTQEIKNELQKIAKKNNIHIDPNHWFSNTRKRIILPIKRGEKISPQRKFYKKNWKFIIQLMHFIDINETREEERRQKETRTRKRKDRKGGK